MHEKQSVLQAAEQKHKDIERLLSESYTVAGLVVLVVGVTALALPRVAFPFAGRVAAVAEGRASCECRDRYGGGVAVA